MNTNEDTALVTVPEHTREEIDALKNTIKASNRDMTDAQFTVFMAAARHLGLDPLARQVVPIFQGGRMTVQTTIDGFRLIAERTRKYRGQLGPFWCGPDGAWRDVWLEDGTPAAAKVGVKRSDFDEPVWGVARFKSYAKGGNWANMPDVMLAKVAESLALRKAFPAELSGAYIREEMLQAQTDGETDNESAPPARPQSRVARRDTTHTTTEPSDIVDATPAASERESSVTTPSDPMDTTIASAEEQQRLAEKIGAAGYKTVGEVARFIASVFPERVMPVSVAALQRGQSDLSLRELATVTQRLTAQANGKAAARG